MVAKHENVKWVDVSGTLSLTPSFWTDGFGMAAVVPLKPHDAQPRRWDDVSVSYSVTSLTYIPHHRQPSILRT